MTGPRTHAGADLDAAEPEPAATEKKTIDLTARLALRPTEAALALGLSERSLRTLLPRLPHLRAGVAVLIPVDALRRWLDEQAQAEGNRTDEIADEILTKFYEG